MICQRPSHHTSETRRIGNAHRRYVARRLGYGIFIFIAFAATVVLPLTLVFSGTSQ